LSVDDKSRYRTSAVLELHMYDNGVNQELDTLVGDSSSEKIPHGLGSASKSVFQSLLIRFGNFLELHLVNRYMPRADPIVREMLVALGWKSASRPALTPMKVRPSTVSKIFLLRKKIRLSPSPETSKTTPRW
jgi:hypothetical protein